MNNAFTDYINEQMTPENLDKRMKEGTRYWHDERPGIDVSKKLPLNKPEK